MISVDEDLLRWRVEPTHGLAHRLHRRLENVDGIDHFDIDARDGTACRALPDLELQLLATSRRKPFRIDESRNSDGRIEDDRRRDHRAGKWSATGFVDAGDEPRRRTASGIACTGEGSHTATTSSTASAAFANASFRNCS